MRKTLKIHYVFLYSQEEMPLFKGKHLVILQEEIVLQEKRIGVDFGEMQKKLRNSKINQIIILNLQGLIVKKTLMTLLVHK